MCIVRGYLENGLIDFLWAVLNEAEQGLNRTNVQYGTTHKYRIRLVMTTRGTEKRVNQCQDDDEYRTINFLNRAEQSYINLCTVG
jgi:hypothetical protein